MGMLPGVLSEYALADLSKFENKVVPQSRPGNSSDESKYICALFYKEDRE